MTYISGASDKKNPATTQNKTNTHPHLQQNYHHHQSLTVVELELSSFITGNTKVRETIGLLRGFQRTFKICKYNKWLRSVEVGQIY